MGDPYVVEVKPSARRAARAAGEWVAERGRYRAFDSKPLAHEWARSVAPQGRTLWIQDAHPLDGAPLTATCWRGGATCGATRRTCRANRHRSPASNRRYRLAPSRRLSGVLTERRRG
jgi:hypothetical protein